MKKEEFQQNMKDRMQQFEDGGLRLLKKGQKGIVHAIFSRFGLVLLLMLLQVGVLWSVPVVRRTAASLLRRQCGHVGLHGGLHPQQRDGQQR